jgi:lysophospholipase L1-like esterase
MRRSLRPWPAAAWLLLASAAAAAEPRAEDRHGLPDLTVHDFAAKYLMQTGDLADLHVYADANRKLVESGDKRPRVVLIGDSITFHWEEADRPAPAGLNVVNRGVVGQNTDQMLMRFEADVVALSPAAVVLAGGTNDARVYVGPPAEARNAVVARIARNYRAMADIADANHIKVVIAAITPCRACAVTSRDPATIVAANAWLRQFAAQRGYAFVDYYAALADAGGQLAAPLSKDGLHTTEEGYHRMWALLAPIISRFAPPSR